MPTLEARFEETIRGAARLVRAAIARSGGAAARAQLEDLEQEVYLSLWRRFRAEGGPPAEIVPAYLYRAAVRETVRASARRAREPERDEEAEPVSPQPDPELRARGRELGRQIEAALGGMTTERRRAVAAHLHGFEIAEIMELFGWEYQRARNLVARGMADLRRALATESTDGRS